MLIEKNIFSSFSLGIWQLTEGLPELQNLAVLRSIDTAFVSAYKAEFRQRQSIGVLLLLQQLTGANCRLCYYSSGKPYLDGLSQHISISHSHEMIVAAVSDKPVGIDIEMIHPRIKNIAGRFLHPEEMEFLGGNNDIVSIHLLWSAKEAMFKLQDNTGVNFAEDLRIAPFVVGETGEMQGQIIRHGEVSRCNCKYRMLNGYCLVTAEFCA
jgi:4'-phosphopantetheinyl transferase